MDLAPSVFRTANDYTYNKFAGDLSHASLRPHLKLAILDRPIHEVDEQTVASALKDHLTLSATGRLDAPRVETLRWALRNATSNAQRAEWLACHLQRQYLQKDEYQQAFRYLGRDSGDDWAAAELGDESHENFRQLASRGERTYQKKVGSCPRTPSPHQYRTSTYTHVPHAYSKPLNGRS